LVLPLPPPGRVVRRVGAAPARARDSTGVDVGAEPVPGSSVPEAHGVVDGVRRRGRRDDVEHGGVPVGGGAAVAVLVAWRGRRDAVRAGGEVGDGAVQPDEPLHAVPARRRRHPGVAGHGRVARHRPAAVVRERQGQGRGEVREPHRRIQPDRRGHHRRERDDRRAGRDVVVQVPQEPAQVHARVPDRGAAQRQRVHLERDAGELAGVEHPPGVQPGRGGAVGDDPGAGAVPEHGRHQPGLVLRGAHRGLLRGVRGRLRGHQERVGRVRHRGGHAERAHRGAAADVRVAHERGHRAGQRDVRRHRGRARRGRDGGGHGVGGARQDGGGEGRVRARRVRAPDAAGRHEARVLDDGGLPVAPGRRVRPQGRPRGGKHQLPGRGGHRRVQGDGQDAGHPGRALPGHLPRQRHHRAHQVQEVPLELRRRRGRLRQRHPAALPAAPGIHQRRRRRLPLPHGHAAHRQGHRAAVWVRRPQVN
jgi:hypothetical protein